jgi:N-acetylglutamate synthase-like GNAT family acetyltransferase
MNKIKHFYLKPLNQKSFDYKALVIQNGNISKLQSYDTIVAEYNHETNKMKINGYYSLTTMKHINAFLDYYGFDTVNKRQLQKFYLTEKN